MLLSLLTVPYLHGGRRFDGLLRKWPDECDACVVRACESAKPDEMGLCPQGFNYKCLARDLVLAGFVAADYAQSTQARTKKRRRYRGSLVSGAELEEIERRIAQDYLREQEELSAKHQRLIEEYRSTAQYKQEFLELIRPEVRRGFSYIHDYRQFISCVSQNLSVILERRYGGTLENQLKAATRSELCIYWAAKLMDEKLKTALFLLEPERITDVASFTSFRFYGMVDKYVRVYTSSFDEKEVTLELAGNSYGNLRGNSEAVAIIPHTFIDNAYKYAPRRSRAEVVVDETNDALELSVSSFGPLIKDYEFDRIFEPFARGEAAKAQHGEGMGVGLYLARFVARKMGTDIAVTQDRNDKFGGCYWTTFSAVFPKKRSESF